jgi:hypothetical protein
MKEQVFLKYRRVKKKFKGAAKGTAERRWEGPRGGDKGAATCRQGIRK